MPRRARRWGGSRVISTSSNRMVPAVGASAPEIALNRVVLPAPFGPMMARRSPDLTESVTPSTARNASNATTTLSSWRAGSDTAAADELSGFRASALPDALELARIGRLFHVDFGVVFPELRDVRVSLSRHVPVFAIVAFDDLANLDVVDRIAIRIELDGLAQRRIVELGLEDRVDQGRAVVGLAAELLDRAGDPHHARVHREAVERGDLAVLLGMLLDEFLRHRIGRAFGELGGRHDAFAFG